MSRRDESCSPLAQIFACFAFFGICIATLMRSEGHPMIVVVAGFGLAMSLGAVLGALFGRMRLGLAVGFFIAVALLVTIVILACAGVLTYAPD